MNYGANLLLYFLIVGIPLIAQIQIMSSYNKYKKVNVKSKLSGFEVARKILDANGLEDIYVVEVSGNLTDHYDPIRKTVRLSTDVFHGNSVAATSIAAHECGHAIQDKESYMPMRLRSFLVPLVNLVSRLSWLVIFIGLITEYFKIFLIGIGLISVGLLFQLITLPVEFNASSRAKKELLRLDLVSSEEHNGVSKVLWAAAMTYVASVLTSILEILRLIMSFNRKR